MTVLRFAQGVYVGVAVDDAAKQFAEYAEIALSQEDEHWVVSVTHEDKSHEALVAKELANMALGLTIDAGGPR